MNTTNKYEIKKTSSVYRTVLGAYCPGRQGGDLLLLDLQDPKQWLLKSFARHPVTVVARGL